MKKQSAAGGLYSSFGIYRIGAAIFAALLLFGAVVRIYGAWQLRHNLNPDSGIAALMAKHMAEGTDFPVFFYGQAYMGSLEPMVSALFCAIFGCSGFMVTLGTAFVGWLVMFAVFAWARDAHSPAAGLAAAAYCVIGPSGFFHYQVSPRGGYAVTVLLSTLILWLISKLISNGREDNLRYRNFKDAAGPEAHALHTGFYDSGKGRAAASLPRRPNLSSKGCWFLLGLLAGLGWWSNQLIVSAILTAAVMALLFLRWRVCSFNTLAAGLGFFAGSLPFWWWNARNGWQSFEFAGSLGQTPLLTGLKIFFSDRLPDLLNLNNGPVIWRVAGAVICLAAAVYVFAVMLRSLRNGRDNRRIYLLAIFVFIVVSALIFSTSHFARMNTSRYLLPLVPVWAVLLGVATARLAERIPVALGLIPLMIVIAGQTQSLSGLARRGGGEENYQRQIEECGQFLQTQEISACYAPYGKHGWNFALDEKIIFCDLPGDRYWPYLQRADQADRIAVLDNLGDIQGFIAGYGGNTKLIYSGSTPINYDFVPPQGGLKAVALGDIDSIRDSLDREFRSELTDGNMDTAWNTAVAEGDDDWLEITFRTPQTVCAFRLLFTEYPGNWQATGQGTDNSWRILTPCIQTAGYFWSGPRPYWGFGMEGYRLECRLPPEKLKRLRIHRIENGYRLMELQLFAAAPSAESEASVFGQLSAALRQQGIKRLYCDRWIANAVSRDTKDAVQTSLSPEIFNGLSLIASNSACRQTGAVWFTPRTGILVRREDESFTRRALENRLVEMRRTNIGPWILFDFEPGKWKPEYGRDCELRWAGYACLTGNNKHWAAELVSRADLCRSSGKKAEAVLLLQKASEAWPFYPPVVERLAEITGEQGRAQEAEYWQLQYKILSQPEIRAPVKFGNGIELAGLSFSTNILTAGDSLTVKYYWKCPPNRTSDKPWVFVHFLNGSDFLQDDHPLEKFEGVEYQPFSELFVETRHVIVPETAPGGEYQIRIGLYDASQADQKRFNVATFLPNRLNAVELPVKLTVKIKK